MNILKLLVTIDYRERKIRIVRAQKFLEDTRRNEERTLAKSVGVLEYRRQNKFAYSN